MGISWKVLFKSAFALCSVVAIGSFAELLNNVMPQGTFFFILSILFVVSGTAKAANEWKKYGPLATLLDRTPAPIVEGLMNIASPGEFVEFLQNELDNASKSALKWQEIAKEMEGSARAAIEQAKENEKQMRSAVSEARTNAIALEQEKKEMAQAIKELKSQLQAEICKHKEVAEHLQAKYAAFENNDMEGMRSFYQSQVGRLNRSGKHGTKRRAELAQED
jgi:hypothetical protein